MFKDTSDSLLESFALIWFENGIQVSLYHLTKPATTAKNIREYPRISKNERTLEVLASGRDFPFFVKDRARLEFSPFSPVQKNIAELGITGQKFSGAHARQSPFSYIRAGDGIFFPPLRTALACV
jgi:hypothetical protein